MPIANEKVALGTSSTSYSKGIVAGPGRLVFISGQVALDDSGNVVSPGDMEAQTRFAFDRIALLLREAGGSLVDVVKLTTFITDMGQYASFSKVRGEVFSSPYPASSAVEVSNLIKPHLVVEIEAVAVLGDSRSAS